MSQIPSDPGTDGRRRSLSYDELIALFVAFLTLGSVLFWGLTRSGVNLFGNASLFSADGALPLIAETDSDNPLAIADLSEDLEDLSLDTLGDDGEIGFGTAEALGAGALGDMGRSAQQAADQLPLSTATDRDNVSAAGTTTPGATDLPQQQAQPAAPTDASSEDEVTAEPATLPPLEASREALQFQDVPDDYWAKPYIDALSERLVIEGLSEDTFAPDQPVTRAQLASAIAQAFPISETEAGMSFSDIESDYWAIDSIDKAVKIGFMNGFPDDTFKPGLPVPRAQVLTALATGLNANVPENAQAIVDRYSDANQIPEWAVGKMAAATQSQLVVNYPNLDRLQPNQPATRAEVAAMLHQALAAQGRIEEIDGEYVVTP